MSERQEHMPVWLTVMLAVYGSLAPIGAALYKWGKGMTDSIRNMSQWFDPNSALGQSQGTLPAQIAALEDHILGLPQMLIRMDRIERAVTDLSVRTKTHGAEIAALKSRE